MNLVNQISNTSQQYGTTNNNSALGMLEMAMKGGTIPNNNQCFNPNDNQNIQYPQLEPININNNGWGNFVQPPPLPPTNNNWGSPNNNSWGQNNNNGWGNQNNIKDGEVDGELKITLKLFNSYISS